jgi:hypothetical protein
MKWVLKDFGVMCGQDACVSGQGPVADSCKDGIGHSVSIKCEEYLDQLSDCQFFTKDSAQSICQHQVWSNTLHNRLNRGTGWGEVATVMPVSELCLIILIVCLC